MDKADYLVTAIEQYVNDNIADHAIMIEGPWGCGKTYYWKNTVAPSIAKRCSGIKPIHVSLFGLNKEQCVKSVLFHCVVAIGKVGKIIPSGGILSSATKGFGKWLQHQSWYQIEGAFLSLISGQKLLICLDDVERSEMSESDFLSIVNSLTEQYGFFVVALCNEDALITRHYVDKTYNIQKEKCFSKTFHFISETDTVICAIINELKESEAKKWIHDKSARIIELFVKIKLTNFRAVKRILYYLCRIITPCLQKGNQPSDELMFDAFLFLASCVIEMDVNGISRETFVQLRDYNSIAQKYVLLLMKKEQKDTKDIVTGINAVDYYLNYFQLHIGNNYNGILWFESIYYFIIHGYLNDKDLLLELTSLTDEIPEPKRSIKVITQNVYNLTSNDFDRSLTIAWSALRSGKVDNPDDFVRLINAISWFIKEEICNISRKELHDIAYANLHVACSHVKRDFSFTIIPEYLDDFANQILIAIENEISRAQKEQLANDAFQILHQFILCKIDSLNEIQKNTAHEPILSNEHADIIVDNLVKIENKQLYNLSKFIDYRYDSSNICHYLSAEKDFLLRIEEGLSNILIDCINSLRKGIYRYLLKGVQKSIKRLNNDDS